MDLDPVREEFIADTGDFVRNMEAAIEAANQFADAVHGDIDALLELQATLDALPLEKTVHIRFDTSGMPEAAAAAAAAGAGGPDTGATADVFRSFDDILAEYEQMQARAGDASAASGTEAAASAAGFDAQADAMQAAREAADADAASQLTVAAATEANSKAQQDSAGAARNATRFWGVMPLTWNAIHWAITGTAEALAVIVPAMVALGAAGMVGLQGAVDVAQRMDAVYQATEATYSYLGKTVSTGLGQGLDSFTASAGQAANAGSHLHDMLQQAQNAAQPRVYELLGSVIEGATDKFGVFNQVGSQTITMLDQFAAKIDIELKGPMGNLGQQISQNSVGDLQQLGQVFGNIGHAIAYAAGEMPGMANLLLTILDDGTQVLTWALHFQGVLETLFLAHEAYMWGGVLQNALKGVSSALASATVSAGAWAAKAIPMEAASTAVEDGALSMGGALESTASFMAGPWGLAIGAGAVALALLIPKLADAKTQTEQWISSLEQAVSQATGLQQIGVTYSALQQVTLANAQAQKSLSAAMSDSDNRISGVQERLSGPYTGAITEAAQKASDLSAAQQQLSRDWATEYSNVQYLSSAFKISYVDAAQLASDAGVSLTQTLKGNSLAAQEARQQILNLIAGYGGMASVGSELGQDINAVSLATEIQNGDVSKLNQAWDTFISTVQAPSSTFLSFAQSLAQFSQDAGQAGASMDGLGGSYTKASHDVDQAAIQLQQDFNTSVSSAEQMLDSMRTVAAVTGNGGPLVAGIKDTVAALIPMAGTNKAAQAQLFALAQEAGGPASGSMQELAKWTGNTKDPLNALYNLSMKASTALQQLGADTQALAATVQSTLNQTLVTEAQNLTGVSGKTATYLSDLQKYGPSAAVTQAALANLNDATSQSTTLASQAADGINVLSQKEQQQADAAKAASNPTQQLNTDIQGLLQKAPNASGAIQNLTSAIENQGLKSTAAAGARAQLIKDLEALHVNAQQATTLVDDLITAIDRIPASKTVALNVIGNGATLVNPSSGTVYKIGGHTAAEGWHVPGYGGGDTVPAMLEPGEAVVPKHLVPAVAPFLGAHHVPGFAAGGKVGSWDMADVFALWGKEVWAQDLHGHGAGHPIAEAAIKALLTSVTQPAKLSGIWDNPLWRGFAGDLKADMSGYAAKDLEYWTVLGDEKALKAAEKAKIAHDLHEMHLHHLKDQPGWVSYYEKQMQSLETADSKTLVNYAAMLGVLRREGFSSGGPVRSYDSGGYLPVGLSMAYNGTGKPEAVGGGGAPEVHVHLHGDLADDTLFERMKAKVLDYGYANSGRPTGVWQPGG